MQYLYSAFQFPLLSENMTLSYDMCTARALYSGSEGRHAAHMDKHRGKSCLMLVLFLETESHFGARNVP